MDDKILMAALAGLLYEIGQANAEFIASTPFDLQNLGDTVSLASELAVGRESSKESVPAQLQSIFALLQIQGQRASNDEPRYILMKPLAMQEDTIFPATEGGGNGINDQWTAVSDAMASLHNSYSNQKDIEPYLENLMLLLQRELWCVPSRVSGTSLFDHARATAALTVCLSERTKQNEAIATLVGGDISGIQSFIYTITSKGAASALRGRSLYLQLLTDAIARNVLRELCLPITNLLFSGGGHFFILACPNANLKTVRQIISQILLSLHSGELYLALEGVSLEEKDFSGKALSEKWRELSDQLRRGKLHKFSELEDELHSLVFEPRRDEGNREKECAVCGREHHGTKIVDGKLKCPQCLSYEKLGKDLREARYLRISLIQESVVNKNDPPGDVKTALAYFGLRAKLYDSLDEMEKDKETLDGAKRSIVYALRDDSLKGLQPDANTAIGCRFLVNVTPTVKDEREQKALRDKGVKEDDLPKVGEVKSFEALEAESRGVKRLGVLRMDVDNMGVIISEGLGEKANLARIANLSFMINLFFEGWAAEVARKYNREGGADTDSVYSIYSGGDDLFFVGAWDRMPELALEIRNDLASFACHHPGVHASAGIALVGGKYPLYQAAEDALEALEKSKAHEGKNAITFLGQTIAWEQFADEVKSHADRLRKLVESRSVPRSLVQRLQQFQLQFQEKQEEARSRGEAENRQGEEQVVWGPWNWRAVYFLTRVKVKEDAIEVVTNIRNKLGDEYFRAIEWIGLMARWVDLLTR